MKTFIIAEAGANHNKNWDFVKKMVMSASSAGANAIKFQHYTSGKLYSKETPDFGAYKDIPSLISSIEIPREWCKDLKSLCDDFGIEFMSTPFDEDAVDLLYNAGVKRMKIAAFEATDPRLVRHVASTKLPIIFSAGIGSGPKQVQKTLSILFDVNPDADVTILHCNSSYPTPFSDINLGQLWVLRQMFGRIASIGLSDHTPGILIPPVAVALGARVIEKHFTLSRCLPGPDHPFAIEPDELHTMCRNIRDVESSLGLKVQDRLTPSEAANEMKFALRSLVARRQIKPGEVLTPENTTTKRPYVDGNVSASNYDEIIGRFIAREVIDEDAMITHDKITKI